MKGYHSYQSCVDTCLHCAAICNHCASACLQEDDVKMMARCIELDMQCAAICYTAAQLMSLGNDKASEVCRMCADIVNYAVLNAQSTKMNLRECAEACGKCAEECKKMQWKKFTELLPFVLPEKFYLSH